MQRQGRVFFLCGGRAELEQDDGYMENEIFHDVEEDMEEDVNDH